MIKTRSRSRSKRKTPALISVHGSSARSSKKATKSKSKTIELESCGLEVEIENDNEPSDPSSLILGICFDNDQYPISESKPLQQTVSTENPDNQHTLSTLKSREQKEEITSKPLDKAPVEERVLQRTRRSFKASFERKVESFRLKAEYCMVCYGFIDRKDSSSFKVCPRCKYRVHRDCSFSRACLSCSKRPKKPRFSCVLCHSGIQRSEPIDPQLKVHLVCSLASSETVISTLEPVLSFEKCENPGNLTTIQEEIFCSICQRKTQIQTLIKCEKCYEFAHLPCILRSQTKPQTWSCLVDLQPRLSALKSVFSKVRTSLLPSFLDSLRKAVSEEFSHETSILIEQTLSELERSLYFSGRSKAKANSGGFQGEGNQGKSLVLAFCQKHGPFSSFACCGRSLKLSYFLNKTLKCGGCLREFHRKCLIGSEEGAIGDERAYYCPECAVFLRGIRESNSELGLEHIRIGEDGSSLVSFPVFMSVLAAQIRKNTRGPLQGGTLRPLLLSACCFGAKFITICAVKVHEFAAAYALAQRTSQFSIELPSVFHSRDSLAENQQKLASIQSIFKGKNEGFDLGKLESLLGVQTAFWEIRSGRKAAIPSINADFLGKYPEADFLERELLTLHQRVLALESEFSLREKAILSNCEELIAYFSETAYTDSIDCEEYEGFLRKAVSLLRKHWSGLFSRSRVAGLMEEIAGSSPFSVETEEWYRRLACELRKFEEFERLCAERAGIDGLLDNFFGFLQGRILIYSEKLEGISEVYLKYKLFKKRLEVFVSLDQKIDLASFVFRSSNRAYEDLYEYVYDVVDLGETPVISLKTGFRVPLFESQGLEALESLLNSAQSLLTLDPTKQESRFSLELRGISRFLEEKSQASQRLSAYLGSLLPNKPGKEVLDSISLEEFRLLLRKSNVYLPVFGRIYERKLARNEEFFTAQIDAALNPEKPNLALERLAVENYSREVSEEVNELIALNPLTESVLKALEQHYENLQRLHIEHLPLERDLLKKIRGLKTFLESLRSLFREFRELPSLQSFLDLENFPLVFERGFFRLETSIEYLKELAGMVDSFPVQLLTDQNIVSKIALFRAFLWLRQVEALSSQTKPKKRLSIHLLHSQLEGLTSLFPFLLKTLENHYMYREFLAFYTRFTNLETAYRKTVIEPLSRSKPLQIQNKEDFSAFFREIAFIRKEAKELNIEGEIMGKRVEEFEVLGRESLKTGAILKKLKEGSGTALEQIKKVTEFAKNCRLTELFPNFPQSKETSMFYQNMMGEIVEVKKVFNEKKLKFAKLVVLQLHTKEKNAVFGDNVFFELELYSDYALKVKRKGNIEEMLELLIKNRFNMRNYKELLRTSFSLTEVLQQNIGNFIREKPLKDLDFSNAVQWLSELIALRNEIIRKPVFFCQEILDFACWELGFFGKCLLGGLIAFNPSKSLENPGFLSNDIGLWHKLHMFCGGLGRLLESSRSMEGNNCDIVSEVEKALSERIGQLEVLRQPIKLLRDFHQFLIENTDLFFAEIINNGPTSQTCLDFLSKREEFINKTRDFAPLEGCLISTRIQVPEDLAFLSDLTRKSQEIAGSMQIINQSLRKCVNGKNARTLPSELVLNVFRSVYSCPFRSERSEEILSRLVSMIRLFRAKVRSIAENEDDSVETLRLYADNPVYIDELEPLLKDLQEFMYWKTRLLGSGSLRKPERPAPIDEDLIELSDDELDELEFSWEECLSIEGKLGKRRFFSRVAGFSSVMVELCLLKLKVIEQISFNRRPKAFFQLTRKELSGLLAEAERLSTSDIESETPEEFKKAVFFMKRFIGKVNSEVLRIAKALLENRGSLGSIKEASQIYGKCVDLSSEIQRLSEVSDAELRLFINRCENFPEFRQRMELPGEKSAPIEPPPAIIERKETSNKAPEQKNHKTFQSIFNKNPAKPPPAPKRGRPAKKPEKEPASEDAAKEQVEEPSGEAIPGEILEIFKQRKEEKGVFSQIERERGRSVDLIAGLLMKNPHLSSDFNYRWVSTRLESQVFQRFSDVGERYRREMIALMDLLGELGKSEKRTGLLLGDEKNINIEELFETCEEEEPRNGEQNPQEMEEETAGGNYEVAESLEGLIEKLKADFSSEVFVVDEETVS